MNCKKCGHNISIKETDHYLTLLCKCEIIIIYPDKIIKNITKKDYKKTYKKEYL